MIGANEREQQYETSSSDNGILSRGFASGAHPQSIVHRSLMNYVATTYYALMRRDAKQVAEWNIQRIAPCHGDNIEGGDAQSAWKSAYKWFLRTRRRRVYFVGLRT